MILLVSEEEKIVIYSNIPRSKWIWKRDSGHLVSLLRCTCIRVQCIKYKPSVLILQCSSHSNHSNACNIWVTLLLQITMHYLALGGPFGSSNIKPKIFKCEFTEEKPEAEYQELPLDSVECNQMLASKTINFRLIMFQVSK